jgi:hypothetical protein
MQTSVRKDMEQLHGADPYIGEGRAISMPDKRTLITAAAIGGGIAATGLILYFYMRARRNRQAQY